MAHTTTCPAFIVWSDAVIDVSGWSRAAQDYSTVLQCVWMMIASQYFALTFALDFVHCFVLVLETQALRLLYVTLFAVPNTFC